MLNTTLCEVFVPVLNKLLGQKVGLVDQQHEFLLVPADILNVLVQVGSVEELWVSGIDDLNQNVGFLDDTP